MGAFSSPASMSEWMAPMTLLSSDVMASPIAAPWFTSAAPSPTLPESSGARLPALIATSAASPAPPPLPAISDLSFCFAMKSPMGSASMLTPSPSRVVESLLAAAAPDIAPVPRAIAHAKPESRYRSVSSASRVW